MLARTFFLAVSGSTPVAFATVAATPSFPSHRSVATGPGDTSLIRMPEGPNSCESAFVDRSAIGLKERVDRGDVDDRSPSLRKHRLDGGARRAQRGEEVHLHGPVEVVLGRREKALQAELDGAHVV